MAPGAGRLAVEQLFATQFLLAGLARIEPPLHIQLRCRGEVQQRLELTHEMHLTATLEHVHPLLGGDYRITVEVGGALLELGEVLDGLQRPLRAEQPLDVHPAQRRRVDAVAERLRAHIAGQVGSGIGVAVRMAVEAGYAAARMLATAIVGEVELLLRKGR